MLKLSYSAVRKFLLLAAALAMLVATFLTGADFYANQSWPFGHGYYLRIRSLIGLPPPERVLEARKAKKARRAEKARKAEEARPATKIVTSGLLNFDLMIHNDRKPVKDSPGGLAVTDGGVLIARDWNGDLYFYDSLVKKVHPIALRLPNNNYAELPDETPDGRKVKKNYHRYNDVEFIRVNGVLSLLVSYTHFDPKRSCFTNRLALRELESGWNAPAAHSEARTRTGWRIVFETQPCLPFNWDQPFFGHQAGGRLAIAADGSIYLTVGDFAFDGRGDPNYPQNPDTDYGKILRIDPSDWSVDQVSMGHRNPQGIVIDDQGRVWSVEHGAMGGDELNLIREGADYGWPTVTLGVNYTDRENDNKSWPLSANQGRHDGYVPPVLAWIRSIGVSNIKQVQNIHPRWDGDLLVSTLADLSLHRIRLLGDRVLYEERIPLYQAPCKADCSTIRYVDVGKGEIYLLFRNGLFATLTPRITDALAAESTGTTASAFETKEQVSALETQGCFECHSNPNTPSLSHILGTKIASQSGVDYSIGLRKKTGTWSETNLGAFLKDPQAFAPGTNMPDMSLSDRQIDEIIRVMMSQGARLTPRR